MRYARVSLGFPPETRHPMHQFVVDHPETDREELWTWNFVGATPTVLFRVVGPLEPYRERIADLALIESFDLTPAGTGAFYAFVRAAPTAEEWEWLMAFARASLVVVPPVVYTDDGAAVFDVLGDPDDLRGLLAELPDSVDTTIERVGEYDRRPGPATPLTDRQREVVAAAVEAGYYEVPREATLEDVAARVDLAPSTVSDHLRKAEAAVMGGITV